MKRPLILLLAAMGLQSPVLAGRVDLPTAFGGAYSLPVQSLRSLQQAATVRQQHDFSCGSAAVATLLTHHYDLPTREQEAFDGMLRHGDLERIRSQGFSMLDMKQYLASRGVQAEGYEAPLDSLVEAGIPGIVLIDQGGYHHFVVVKGLSHGRVVFGDPASGTRSASRRAFEAMRVGEIVLVVTDRRGRFNAEADWRARPAAPMASQGRSGERVSPWLRLERSDF